MKMREALECSKYGPMIRNYLKQEIRRQRPNATDAQIQFCLDEALVQIKEENFKFNFGDISKEKYIPPSCYVGTHGSNNLLIIEIATGKICPDTSEFYSLLNSLTPGQVQARYAVMCKDCYKKWKDQYDRGQSE